MRLPLDNAPYTHAKSRERSSPKQTMSEHGHTKEASTMSLARRRTSPNTRLERSSGGVFLEHRYATSTSGVVVKASHWPPCILESAVPQYLRSVREER